ncbi:MAG: deoxyribonuclease IV [Deltaproteobacteria bacterium]|nr:deoxyribonuclease IV [Deltaproteobacteria bacterium]
MKLGLHLSIAGGLPRALDRAHALGCQAVQIFLQNPRGWRWRPVPAGEIAEFREKRRLHGIDLVVAHLSYLPNMAAVEPELFQLSWERLHQELTLGKALEIDYLVCHPGHASAEAASFDRVAAGLRRIITETPPPPLILLENTSGRKNELGQHIAELHRIISSAGVPLGLCVDTAHAFAAGYNLRLAHGRRQLLQEIAQGPGLAALKIIHLNEALFSCGSHRDRHWHLGQGNIGRRGLRGFLAGCSPFVQGVILETPKAAPDDDVLNLAAARSLL